MRLLLIIANPNPRSFSHALAAVAVNAAEAEGHSVVCHDLYAERFDPILCAEEIPRAAFLDPVIEAHCNQVAEADGIIIVHPNWWGQPPAILKGWIDRVIRPGVAYRFVDGDDGEGVPVGLLKARTALVLNTSNTPREREVSVFGDPLEALWKSCIFDLCGVPVFQRRMFCVMVNSTLEQRQAWLEEARELVRSAFPHDRGNYGQ